MARHTGALGPDSTGLSDLLEGVLDVALEIAEADFGNIQLLDSDQHLRIVAQRNFPDGWIAHWNTVTAGQGACGAALDLGERVIVEDVEQSPIFVGSPHLDVQRKAGVRAVQSTPLVGRQGKLLGMFSTHYRAPHRPGPKEQKVLDLLARHVVALIEGDQAQYVARAVFEFGPVGIASADWSGALKEVNPAFCSMLGYTPDELLGMHAARIFYPDDKADNLAQLQRLKAGEIDHFVVENRYQHKTGEPVWVRKIVALLPGALGCAPITFAMVRDITSERTAEQRRLESESMYRAAVESTTDGFWLVDLEGRLRAVNDLYVARSGYSREELLKMHIEDLDAAMDAETIRSNIKKFSSAGAALFQTLQRTKSGEVWPAEVNTTYRPEAGGRFFAFIRDITERQRVRTELERTRSQLLEAQAIGHMGSFEFDVATGKTSWSRELYLIHGLDPCGPSPSKEELLARFTFPEDVTWLDNQFKRSLQAASTFDAEYRIVRPDGAVRWVQSRGRPRVDANGKILSYSGTVLDITERKESEIQVAQLSEENHQLGQLQVARQTVAALAHELNQPLSAVVAYASAVSKLFESGKADPAKLKHALKASAEQAVRAGGVVHKLLAMLNQTRTETKDMYLEQMLRGALARVRADKLTRIPFHIQTAADLPRIKVNPLQIELVLMNLIRNAIEALEQCKGNDPARIDIGTALKADTVEVTVADNGPGIAPENLQRIFEPFFPPRSQAPAWAWPSAAPSWRSMAGNSGRKTARCPVPGST